MGKKATPTASLICGVRNPDCDKPGKHCAGKQRGSCSGFVCNKHIVIGTDKPFVGKTLCRVCATRQYGTLFSENGRLS